MMSDHQVTSYGIELVGGLLPRSDIFDHLSLTRPLLYINPSIEEESQHHVNRSTIKGDNHVFCSRREDDKANLLMLLSPPASQDEWPKPLWCLSSCNR